MYIPSRPANPSLFPTVHWQWTAYKQPLPLCSRSWSKHPRPPSADWHHSYSLLGNLSSSARSDFWRILWRKGTSWEQWPLHRHFDTKRERWSGIQRLGRMWVWQETAGINSNIMYTIIYNTEHSSFIHNRKFTVQWSTHLNKRVCPFWGNWDGTNGKEIETGWLSCRACNFNTLSPRYYRLKLEVEWQSATDYSIVYTDITDIATHQRHNSLSVKSVVVLSLKWTWHNWAPLL